MDFRRPHDARVGLPGLVFDRAGANQRLVRGSILGFFLGGATFALLAIPEHAADLFSFRDRDRILAFAVPSIDPITATVDQREALNAAARWAQRYYGVRDLDIADVEFRTKPTRFWLVAFSVGRGHGRETLYAVVLPDGTSVEPRACEEL